MTLNYWVLLDPRKPLHKTDTNLVLVGSNNGFRDVICVKLSTYSDPVFIIYYFEITFNLGVINQQ